MHKTEYRYFILKGLIVARLEKGKSGLDQKEFYQNGEWIFDEELNLELNDCIMDFGDSRWYEYDEVSETKALEFIAKLNDFR